MHREKLGFPTSLDNRCVARPVGKAEIDRIPAAKASMQKEWDRLRSKFVWDEQNPREWDDVRSEAKRGEGGVHGAHGLFLWNLRRKERRA